MRNVNVIFLGLMAAVLVGCGPNDATINSNVKQKLAADDTVKSATIEASTQKKIVTLVGTVDSQETKDRAAADARQADGVSDVVNQITVAPFGEGRYGPGTQGYGPGMSNAPNGGGGQGSGGSGMNNGGGQGSGGSRMNNGGGMGSGGSGMHHNGRMGTEKMGHTGGQRSGNSTPPPPPNKPE